MLWMTPPASDASVEYQSLPANLPDGLWDHQRAALDCFARFIASPDSSDKAALLTLPTGTGKTGVIAVAATHFEGADQHRLVLTPWKALVRQLIDDMKERFWGRLAFSEGSFTPPPVKPLPPSTRLESIGTLEEPTIFVATIAAIAEVSRRADRLGDAILEPLRGFDFLVVDEGHYEPAQFWSEAIRRLKLPTILLTATPYRNDQKYFKIGDEFRYRFPHSKAEEQRFLRTPHFVDVEASSEEEFVEKLVTLVDDHFQGDSDVRVVVRCDDVQRIRDVVSELRRKERSVIGIHEKFRDEAEDLVRRVPDENCDAQYWVHQFKLIEGVDDSRFKVVAFYDSLRNDRAVVQQIGRVLRNPGRVEDQPALVVSRGDRNIEAVWTAYMRFDAQDEPEAAATLPGLVTKILEAQPPAFYYDGAYRIQADLDSDDAWRTLRFLPRALVFRHDGINGPSEELERLVDATITEWEMKDREVFAIQEPNGDSHTRVIPYVHAENSRWLRTSTLIEPRFGYSLLRLTENFLFYFDTRGTTSKAVQDSYLPLSFTELQTLFPDVAASQLTSVSLRNTDLGRQAARVRSVSAASIEDLAPELSDWAYVCSIAEGRTTMEGIEFRRYVGFSHARVTDHRRMEEDYHSYSSWLDQLEQQILNKGRATTTFGRYAAAAEEPEDPTPVNVLFDVDVTRFVSDDGEVLSIDDTAVEVHDEVVNMCVNGEEHDARLGWSAVSKRYEFDSPSLRASRFREVDGDRRELVEVINRDHCRGVLGSSF